MKGDRISISNSIESIGIVDSGIGGLSTCMEFINSFPHESVIYYGDLLFMPYGQKSEDFLIHRMLIIFQFLIEQNCTCILIACNTASSIYLKYPEHFKSIPIPVFDVVSSVLEVIASTDYPQYTILATQATINNGIYQRTIQELMPHSTVNSIAAVEWATLIETERIHSKVMQDSITHYTQNISNNPENCVVLACTHYFFIAQEIKKYLPACPTMDSSTPVLNTFKKYENLNKSSENPPQYSIFTSKETPQYADMVARVFGSKINIRIEDLL